MTSVNGSSSGSSSSCSSGMKAARNQYRTSLQNLSSQSPYLISKPHTAHQTLDLHLTQSPPPPTTSLSNTLPPPPPPPPPSSMSAQSTIQRSPYCSGPAEVMVDCQCDWEKLEEAAKVIANVQHAFEITDNSGTPTNDLPTTSGVGIDEQSHSSRFVSLVSQPSYSNNKKASVPTRQSLFFQT